VSEAQGPSLATKAARGAAWTIATGVGSRALGLAGTLAVTYFVARDELGEVSDAAVAVLLANQLSTLGVGQYYIARPTAGRDVAWHATLVHVTLGAVALTGVLCLAHPLGIWMRAPSLGRFLPGLALSAMLERVAYMPERVLAREMRFRPIGVCRTMGELSYTATSVLLAALGWGAMCIVFANLVRSGVRLVALCRTAARAEWLTPTRLSARTARAMLRFGLPLSVGTAAGFAARRVDNAIVSGLFGAGVVGAYNLAYNVADVPGVQIGEQIGDVLLPSFSHMQPAEGRAALVRSTGLLALVTFPLAVGLGAVAPALVDTLLKPEWRDVGPMLALLSILSVVRPVGWTISSYLLARDRPRVDAGLEILKVAALVILLLTLGRLGPLWACAAVGLAFALHAIASMAVVQATDGVTVSALAARCAAPLAACVPMIAAVAAARAGLEHAGVTRAGIVLAAQIFAGAVSYPAAALVLARSTSLDLIAVVTSALRRRTAPSLRATSAGRSRAPAGRADRRPCTRTGCDRALGAGRSSAATTTCAEARRARANRGR
jgi:PST family polysaccharide transporter